MKYIESEYKNWKNQFIFLGCFYSTSIEWKSKYNEKRYSRFMRSDDTLLLSNVVYFFKFMKTVLFFCIRLYGIEYNCILQFIKTWTNFQSDFFSSHNCRDARIRIEEIFKNVRFCVLQCNQFDNCKRDRLTIYWLACI